MSNRIDLRAYRNHQHPPGYPIAGDKQADLGRLDCLPLFQPLPRGVTWIRAPSISNSQSRFGVNLVLIVSMPFNRKDRL